MTRALLLAGLFLLARAPAAQEPEEDDLTRFFALPMVRDTQELAAVAEEHLAAERYPEALQALQRILEQHANEVLAPERGPTRTSYPGAAEWALQRLFALPPAARAEYAARYEPRAAEALARARRSPQRASLASIPLRWPIAPSAVGAWWSLGDLELESGALDAAELAWKRALELASTLGIATPPSAARRAWLEARARERAAGRSAPHGLPRGDAEHWSAALDLAPFVQRGPAIGRNLLPIASDDLVLASSTLRLFALDAYSGEPRWSAGPPRGWSALAPGGDARLFAGINFEQLVLAPAAGEGVALAVLQEPFTENDNEDWQGIQIMTAIPERRLHAFDLADGHELWNHAPELAFDTRDQRWTWNGGGSYAQRMMIAGSPTIAGPRVLVPCYRMQGRIDYHVACYELATGDLLWSTPVLSGQRERNMFGRSVNEFCASPLVVSEDRVVAQTELGTLAALDLFTGRVLWQTTYRQIPLPKTRSYNAPPRPIVWRLAPPVRVDDLLIATPSDSNEILAVRFSDGGVVWSYTEERLHELDHRTRLLGFRLLLGADHDALYLGGSKISALQKPGGLASNAAFVPLWTETLDRPDNPARIQLFGDYVLVPSPLRRETFDRRTGARVPALSGPWGGGEVGNLWLADGALFSLSTQGISGYFDWEIQLERARRSAGPGADAAQLEAAAQLFLRRGKLTYGEGALESAYAALLEARGFFARLAQLDTHGEHAAALDCARTLAEVLFRRQREDEALAVLADARTLASGRAELAPLLFQEERVRRARGGAARIAVLDQIEACAGQAPLPEDTRLEALRAWAANARGESTSEPEPGALPTDLWVALERAAERERAGELAEALDDLHTALARAAHVTLVRGLELAQVVRARISAVLALPHGREAYAALEARAGELFAAAEAHGDEAGFAEVLERYPHSRAADQALGRLLERAEDARAVADLVASALARGGLTPERETELDLRLARALGRAGNTAYERGRVTALARAEPGRVSPLTEHHGLTLAALAAELAKDSGEPAAAPATFGDVRSTGRLRPGSVEFLGTLRPENQAQESAPLELHVYARRDELSAYSSQAPGEPAWTRALEQPLELGQLGAAFAPGRMLYATRSDLVCLDVHGEERWTHPTGTDPVRALGESGGVLVLRLRSGAVRAADSALGLALWERTLEGGGDWEGPVLGDGYAVFFQRLAAQGSRALVLDLYRGRITADVRFTTLGAHAEPAQSAWIAAERLVVPDFDLRPAQLSGYALEGGHKAWTIEFLRDEELHAVVHCSGRSYPVTLAAALDSAAGNGGVYELDERLGSVRRVVPLKPGERLMGLEAGMCVELDAPYVFPFTYSESERSVPIRAVHLANGVQWTWSLPIASQEIYDPRSLPLPAVSAECIALAYQTRRTAPTQGAEATIVLLDKRAGKKLGTLLLGGSGGPFAQSSRLALRGLGEALFVLGTGSAARGAGLEILETSR